MVFPPVSTLSHGDQIESSWGKRQGLGLSMEPSISSQQAFPHMLAFSLCNIILAVVVVLLLLFLYCVDEILTVFQEILTAFQISHGRLWNLFWTLLVCVSFCITWKIVTEVVLTFILKDNHGVWNVVTLFGLLCFGFRVVHASESKLYRQS